MAARATIKSGDWAATGGDSIWDGDGSVPVSGDVVTITLGHVVTLNTEYIATVDLGGLVVNGTLNCCTTAKASLKVSANITGSGTINCGGYTDGVLDITKTLATNLVMVFDFDGTAYGFNSSNLALNFYCWNPTDQYALTTGAEGSSDAIITVDRDITEWVAFKTASGLTTQLHVNDVGGTLPEATLEELSSFDAELMQITLVDNLSAVKLTGAYVILLTRNIRLIGTNSTGSAVAACKAASVLGCEIAAGASTAYGLGSSAGNGCILNGSVWGYARGISFGSGHTNNGAISGCTYGIYSGSGHTNNGAISGCSYGIYSGCGHINNGTISGCTYGIYFGSGCINRGTISGCSAGMRYSMVYLFGGTLSNTTDVYYSEVRGYGATFSGTTENDGYISLPYTYSYSKNHDGVAGAFRSWSGGGNVQSETSIVPSGIAYSYKHTCETASYPCIRQEEMLVDPGKTLKIRGYFKLGAEFSIAPKLELLAADGITSLGDGTSDAVDSLTDTTNWQAVNVSWTNTASYAQTVIVKASAQHASNTCYEAWEILSQDLSDYVAKADVVDPAFVLEGRDNYTDGDAGTLSLDMPAIGDAIDINACVCQYKMNDNAAGKLVIDAMHTYHGLAVRNTNLMHTTGKIEGGFLLDGSADYIDCNTSFQSILQDSFATSVWVKIPSYTGTLFIFGTATAVSGKGEFILQVDTGDDTLMLTYSDIDSGFEQKEMDVPASMKSATSWTHIVINATKNDTIEIYIDGVLYGTADVSDIDFARWINSYHLTLGAFNNGGTMEGFSGVALDNFCVFERALTADEIALLYNGGSGTETTVLDDADDSDMAEYERAAAAAQMAAFGKSVIYKPYGGTEKTITAIISRDPAGRIGGGKQTVGPKLSVFVLNDATSGVLSSGFLPNKDRIVLPVVLNETATERLMTRILKQDAGMLEIEVN